MAGPVSAPKSAGHQRRWRRRGEQSNMASLSQQERKHCAGSLGQAALNFNQPLFIWMENLGHWSGGWEDRRHFRTGSFPGRAGFWKKGLVAAIRLAWASPRNQQCSPTPSANCERFLLPGSLYVAPCVDLMIHRYPTLWRSNFFHQDTHTATVHEDCPLPDSLRWVFGMAVA